MNDSHKFSVEDGDILVSSARKVVTEFLKNGKKIKLDEEIEKKF